VIEEWKALLRYLKIEMDLTPEPSQDDLDRIDLSGFVRTAVEQLSAKASDSYDAEAKAAEEALLRLYQMHVQMGN